MTVSYIENLNRIVSIPKPVALKVAVVVDISTNWSVTFTRADGQPGVAADFKFFLTGDTSSATVDLRLVPFDAVPMNVTGDTFPTCSKAWVHAYDVLGNANPTIPSIGHSNRGVAAQIRGQGSISTGAETCVDDGNLPAFPGWISGESVSTSNP